MSGSKKPDAVFKVGDQAWAIVPGYTGNFRMAHVLVDVVDAKRTYVTVKAVDPAQRLHPDKSDYHMQTGQVRNRDRFGSYAPRLMTRAEYEIMIRTDDAHAYLESNGIWSRELRGFWKERGALVLADVLRQAEDDHTLALRNQEKSS